jgi:enoyl-CoA hydratase/carnithine racemase
MAPYEHLRYSVSSRVATITLDRPERLNAWTPTMEGELRAVMNALGADESVRAIVLTGAGRGFCAGLDFDLLKERAPSGGAVAARRSDDGFSGRFTYFPKIEKPIIAAVNGPAAGVGLSIALGCDLRFAATSATFTTSFARRGLAAEHGIAWMLPRVVGLPHALDLLLSARTVGAEEACRIGLCNRVVSDAELLASSVAYAVELAERCSPRSLRIIKRQLWEATAQPLSEVLDIADREMNASFASEDFQEGVAHFREKRVARFSGR